MHIQYKNDFRVWPGSIESDTDQQSCIKFQNPFSHLRWREIVNSLKPFKSIFVKSSILDAWLDSKYTFTFCLQPTTYLRPINMLMLSLSVYDLLVCTRHWRVKDIIPAGNYIRSKLTIETLERRQWGRSSVFIVNFEQISQLVLVFLMLTLSR